MSTSFLHITGELACGQTCNGADLMSTRGRAETMANLGVADLKRFTDPDTRGERLEDTRLCYLQCGGFVLAWGW